ncbi:MAG: thiamine pyrophosphate-dependent enzyme, partial [Lachnospirales bacterium]
NDADVKNYIGKKETNYNFFDTNNPITIGSYMNEPDILNNKLQLSQALDSSIEVIKNEFDLYFSITGRKHNFITSYKTEDAKTILVILGSAYETATLAVDILREKGEMVGVLTINLLRPLPSKVIFDYLKNAKKIIVANRQDSYGTKGGELTRDIKSVLFDNNFICDFSSVIYGLGGRDLFVEDCIKIFTESSEKYYYYGVSNEEIKEPEIYFEKLKDTSLWDKTNIKALSDFPKRIAPGHGACAGCGIPVNLNLFLKGIKGEVALLFQTGCGMVVTTAYPKTAFKVSYIHNLFQNGAATLSGIVEYYNKLNKKDITFIMVTGDGGLDIGLGSALGAAIRNHKFIIFEYDNGGYMNTGYQLSYSTPKGAKSSTSHKGKAYFNKDNPKIFRGTNINYIATVSESNPMDLIKKAQKAQYYANNYGLVYIKAISVCPLNWRSEAKFGRKICDLAVKSCYHPLYEIEKGKVKINYNPELKNEKIPISEWFKSMGRTKDILSNKDLLSEIQNEVDRRWRELKLESQ